MKRFILLLTLPLTAAVVSAQPCEPGSADALLDGNNAAAAVYNNGLLFWNGQGRTF